MLSFAKLRSHKLFYLVFFLAIFLASPTEVFKLFSSSSFKVSTLIVVINFFVVVSFIFLLPIQNLEQKFPVFALYPFAFIAIIIDYFRTEGIFIWFLVFLVYPLFYIFLFYVFLLTEHYRDKRITKIVLFALVIFLIVLQYSFLS
jgi:hypothetical protein